MRNTILYAIGFIVIACIVCLDNVSTYDVTKNPMRTSLGAYTPKELKSFEEIPQQIREKVTNHLKARLGNEFYQTLRFSGGQVVDFNMLYFKYPEAKNFKWEVHAYDLHFEFQKPEVGITSYTAQIKLRSDGSVLKEIDLPCFSAFPAKLHFISLKNAEEIARKRGLNPEVNKARIDYDRKKDLLVWRFTEVIADDGLRIKFKNIEVSVHDGSIVREFKDEGIR